ncbi:hypothetical protein CBOM_02185 [Ceraceosorus bombacis]|uniref:Uncharacterized protein n=1 Tax=Ceraceosorus bombacis TaxID=401625 RepID=A0A0P1BFA3_9BASI|nr:hypothetical protein CBOM_02185 [Ceraceosorus bombacis]
MASVYSNLTVTDIEKRLKLMANLSKEAFSGELPSPPSSPRLQARNNTQDKARASGRATAGTEEADATESATSKKRKVSTRADDVGAQTKERRLSDSSDGTISRSKREDKNQSKDTKRVDVRSLHCSLEITLPLDRRWDKDLFVSTAASFRARGRSLKHQGDQRLREESTMRIGSSPSSAACIATFEQMDAVLLYVYSFWCEDEAAAIDTGTPGVIIAANWNTIFGLLKYVCDCQERNGFPALAGLCRLIEALVLRKVSDNENRLLQRRLAKLVASSAAIANTGSTYVAAGQSPSTPFGDTAAPSPASHHSAEVPPGDLSSAIADISSIMRKTVGESERSARLFAQARNALSPSTLQDSFPDVWQTCLACSTVVEPVRDALRLNPEGFGSSSCVTDDAPSARWAWPLDHVTPLPHYVNFGRALLREAAARKNLKFQLAAITSHRS